MTGRLLALAAALLMGAPASATGSVIWVELCAADRPGTRMPLPVHRDEKDGPGKACHAACASLGERRQRLRGR